MTDQRIGKWMFTYTGAKFWPFDPRSEEIDLTTIAYSLSKQCRYAGHTQRFYSIAEHCLWLVVAYLTRNDNWIRLSDAPALQSIVDVINYIRTSKRRPSHDDAIVALWLLMHDATEGYLQDMLRPIKSEMPDYRVLEDKLTNIVAHRFSLPLPVPEIVHILDSRIVLDEVEALGPHFTRRPPGQSLWASLVDWAGDLEPIGIPAALMGSSSFDDVAGAFIDMYCALAAARSDFRDEADVRAAEVRPDEDTLP